MNDKQFLIWLHERLVRVHSESLYIDYMHKLRAIIDATPRDQETPNDSSKTNPIEFYVSNLIQDNQVVIFSEICAHCGKHIFSSNLCKSATGHRPSGIIVKNIGSQGGDHANNQN